MNNNEKSSLKRKGTAIVAVICFVAVVSVVSIYTLNNYNRNTAGEQLAKENTVKIQGTSQETNTNEIVLPQVDESTTTQQEEHKTIYKVAIQHQQQGMLKRYILARTVY